MISEDPPSSQASRTNAPAPRAPRKLRVILIDDTADILELYRHLIDSQADLQCVACMPDSETLETAIEAHAADAAVIDLCGPGRDALDAIRAVAARFPDCRIIAFTGRDDPATLERVLDAGAWSLVSKHEHPLRLLDEIRRICRDPA